MVEILTEHSERFGARNADLIRTVCKGKIFGSDKLFAPPPVPVHNKQVNNVLHI